MVLGRGKDVATEHMTGSTIDPPTRNAPSAPSPSRPTEKGRILPLHTFKIPQYGPRSYYMAPPPGRRATGPQRGGRKGDVYRIGGVDLPWDPELDLDKPKPTPLFLAYKPSPPPPLTDKEQAQFTHFKSLRDSVHNGPLYTVLGRESRVAKSGARKETAAAAFNAFEGMPKYTQKYSKRKRAIPKLDTRPYVLKFFPKELWATLDPNHKETSDGGVESSAKGKSLQIPGYRKAEDLSLFENEGEDEEAGEKGEVEEEGQEEGEEVDDEFDEEDEGGDYNAEQYFDDGGEDGGDDYDAGDDGGVDYY